MKFIFYILLFFYIYPIDFIFLPFGITTRIYFAIFGLFFLLKDILKQKKGVKLSKSFFNLIIILALISIISSVSMIINSTEDYEFIKYFMSIFLISLAAYFICKIFLKTSKSESKWEFLKAIVHIVFAQNIIAFIFFIFPDLLSFSLGIQSVSENTVERMNQFLEIRFIGFGSQFFGAGLINGFALLSLSSLYKAKEITFFKFVLFFIILTSFGMMMARTTIVGAILCLIYMVSFKKLRYSDIRKTIKRVSVFIAMTATAYFIAIKFLSDISNKMYRFAFEIFYNINEGGTINTDSTNHLLEMYTLPKKLKTFIIGDGYYTSPTSSGYYMNTDVGYLRLLYYFGIIGLLLFLLFQYKTIRELIDEKNDFKRLSSFLLVYLLILNMKGFTDLFFLLIPILILNSFLKQKASSSIIV